MSSAIVARAANRVVGQRMMSSTGGQVHPGYAKIKAKYAKFQIDDGTPVHLKGGPFDKILYMATMGLCGVGLVGCIDYYIAAGFPKKG